MTFQLLIKISLNGLRTIHQIVQERHLLMSIKKIEEKREFCTRHGHLMKSNFYKFSLGLLSVIILFDLMVIDKQSKNESFIELSATFNKIDGLTEGANIMISGINVGFVDQIKLIKKLSRSKHAD